ncbi:unnamed protein product [Malus fusca]
MEQVCCGTKLRLYKKKKSRGAHQKSKWRPLANRRAGLISQKPDSFLKSGVAVLKSRTPFSKVGRLSQKPERSGITRRTAFPVLSSLVTRAVSFAQITGCFFRKRVTCTVHPFTGCRQGTDCLEILPDCLPSIALECSSSTADVLPKKTPHLPGEQIRQVKMLLEACGDKVLLHLQDQVSFSLLRSSPAQFKHTPVERYFFKSKSIPYHQSQRQRYLMACFSFTLALACETRRKKAIGRHLDRLNKESDHHLFLVPTCHAEETSREECSLQTQSTRQKESELKPRAREASTTNGRISHHHQSSLIFLAKKFPRPELLVISTLEVDCRILAWGVIA